MATILLVDDLLDTVKFVVDRLRASGYTVVTTDSGQAALDLINTQAPDLVLLDVVMPGMNGYQVCREIRANPDTETLPVVMITAQEPGEERVKGLEAGADDFLTTPVNWAELLARVRSLLRIKTLLDTVKTQAVQLEELNRTLEVRVSRQVEEIERLNRLRRFLSPAVAEIVVANDEAYLKSHRREIAPVCCDLRGFTAFSEVADPEDCIDVLREYHRVVGHLVTEYNGTIDHFAGDGIMFFLNDPVPCDQPCRRAVQLALAIRDRVELLVDGWKRHGHELGFGVGVALGFATIGMVGFEGRYDYAATGRPMNLAARLCSRAKDRQVLVSQRVHTVLGGDLQSEFLGEIQYKGVQRPVPTYNVLGLA